MPAPDSKVRGGESQRGNGFKNQSIEDAVMTAGKPHHLISHTSNSTPSWRELRESYPQIASCLVLAGAVLLLTDLSLIIKHIEFGRQQTELRSVLAQTEIQRATAVQVTERNIGATGAGLAHREMLLSRELHLAVDRHKGVMYLRQSGSVLREMPIRLSPETSAAAARQENVLSAQPRGRRVLARVLEAGASRELPESDFARLTSTGSIGPLAIILDDGALIYSQPGTGPPLGPRDLPPGSVRAEAADLEAIKADLQPGMRLYLY